jgi:hypothetical protein
MKMEQLIGKVSKVKILKMDSCPLVRFTLTTSDRLVHCLIHFHSLSFLADVDDNTSILVLGYFNGRKQFVVRQYKLDSKSKILYEFEKSLYPKKQNEAQKL